MAPLSSVSKHPSVSSFASSYAVCRCRKALSLPVSPLRQRQSLGRKRTSSPSPSFRIFAQGGENEKVGGGGGGVSDSSFADQLWSAAREGVQKAETSDNLSVSASSFLSLEDNITFNINEFFSYAKSLYLKQ